ncbi:MAG TPA: amidohydrolase family protein [Thermoanaerobaculia bacterium]|nr:amidohydrolase family protein [Thermoanaerobaculia bacterium]
MLLLAGCTAAGNDRSSTVRTAPLRRDEIVLAVDHHQHFASAGTVGMLNSRMPPGAARLEPITAERVIALLDEAGIRRAVVLSGAFTFGGRSFDPERSTLSPAELTARVRAENEWTLSEVARYPTRLTAFCSFHPQAESAMAELRWCADQSGFVGVKLHLEESDVDLTNESHAVAVRRIFAEANRLRMPIVIHPRNNRVDAVATTEAFLTRILPAAPDVPVQIAHLHGGGMYSEAALKLYADAVSSGNPATRNLLFDVTDVIRTSPKGGADASVIEGMVALMRRIGMERMLYGSDPAVMGRLAPREGWAEFKRVMPLTDEEIARIAANVAPYLR